MLPRYRTILCATDLSANAGQALRHAVHLARLEQGRIHVLHVLPDMEPAVLNYVATVMGEGRLADLELEHKEEVRGQIRSRIEEVLREELSGNEADLALIAGIEVLHGPPVVRLLEAADRLGVDLMVLGSHGKGRLQHAFLGSVAEKVLRRSRHPVLVVPFI